MKKKKLVINADDFGYKEGINKGIIFAHKNGMVTSTSLFVEREGTSNAVRLAKKNPDLGLGLHLDLDKYFEIDHHYGKVIKFIDSNTSLKEVESEIRRQLEKFYSFGFISDHIDSHHHAHLYPEVFPITCKLAKEFKIPVIRFFEKFYSTTQNPEDFKKIAMDSGLILVDNFIEGWYWGNVDEPYEIAELMTHPGYGELWRETELAHCCQSHLKGYFAEQKIDLLRFSDIVN